MREQLQSRLAELRKEFETGQSQLQELERQQAHLRETLLRISGAILVLEEMLAEKPTIPQNGSYSQDVQPASVQENGPNP